MWGDWAAALWGSVVMLLSGLLGLRPGKTNSPKFWQCFQNCYHSERQRHPMELGPSFAVLVTLGWNNPGYAGGRFRSIWHQSPLARPQSRQECDFKGSRGDALWLDAAISVLISHQIDQALQKESGPI